MKFGSYVASHIYTFIIIKVVIRLEGVHITSQRQRSLHLRLLSDKNQKPPVASTIMHYKWVVLLSTAGLMLTNTQFLKK